jgi:hypothetical protein
MLIKLTDFDNELAEKLKDYTGAGTASKAITIIASDFLDNEKHILDLKEEIQDKSNKLTKLNYQLKEIKSALKILKEL